MASGRFRGGSPTLDRRSLVSSMGDRIPDPSLGSHAVPAPKGLARRAVEGREGMGNTDERCQ
jgi:hypothetical protein